MSLARRKFLRLSGTTAVGRLAGLATADEDPSKSAYTGLGVHRRRLRVGVWYDANFPSRDCKHLSASRLEEILSPFQIANLDFSATPDQLHPDHVDVYFHPYGSAFPVEHYELIYNYLMEGGNWFNLGGAPFSIPVSIVEGSREVQERTDEYSARLGLKLASTITPGKIRKWMPAREMIHAIADNALRKATLFTMEFDPRAGDTIDVKPLFTGMDRDGTRHAVPILRADHREGAFMGGRWVLGGFNTLIEPKEIQALIRYAAFGPVSLRVQKAERDGRTEFDVELWKPAGAVMAHLPAKASLTIRDLDTGALVHDAETFMAVRGMTASATFPVPPHIAITPRRLVEASFDLDRTPLGRLTATYRPEQS